MAIVIIPESKPYFNTNGQVEEALTILTSQGPCRTAAMLSSSSMFFDWQCRAVCLMQPSPWANHNVILMDVRSEVKVVKLVTDTWQVLAGGVIWCYLLQQIAVTGCSVWSGLSFTLTALIILAVNHAHVSKSRQIAIPDLYRCRVPNDVTLRVRGELTYRLLHFLFRFRSPVMWAVLW